MGCWPRGGIYAVGARARRLHSAEIGRYAWLTRNLRTFTRPFPVRGAQGLFGVPDDVIERETLMPLKRASYIYSKHERKTTMSYAEKIGDKFSVDVPT